MEFGDQSGAFRAMREKSRVGSLIWQFRRRLPRYEGPSPPHRPSTGPEWAFVHTPLNRGRRKKTVSCKRGHRSALKRPSWSLRVLTSQALHEGQANHFELIQWCHVNTKLGLKIRAPNGPAKLKDCGPGPLAIKDLKPVLGPVPMLIP